MAGSKNAHKNASGLAVSFADDSNQISRFPTLDEARHFLDEVWRTFGVSMYNAECTSITDFLRPTGVPASEAQGRG